MEERLRESLATSKFNTLLLTLLGAIGVVLAAVGIYGVIAYFVTRRTQEIGVRMALGATRRDVVALVVKQAAWPVAAGIALGMVISAGLTRVLSGQLFGVEPHDPATFALVAIGLAGVALIASLVPARRAASVDPTRALHSNLNRIGFEPQHKRQGRQRRALALPAGRRCSPKGAALRLRPRYLTTTVLAAVLPSRSVTVNVCRPGVSGQRTSRSELAVASGRPSTFHSTGPATGATAPRATVWNSRRSVGSIRYVAPSGGLEIRSVSVRTPWILWTP